MNTNQHDIAIIGLAGHFPKANSADALFSNLSNKVDCTTRFSIEECILDGVPEELAKHPNYVPVKGYLENSDTFDAQFFKFSEYDAQLLDPQFRLLLKTTWETLENSGYLAETFSGKIGLFVGSSNVDTYFQHNLAQFGCSFFQDDFRIALHNVKDFLPNLIAYKLNLKGPSVAVQTACSTSLVSVCMACQSILIGESDMALAGGACITTPLKSGHLFQEGMMLSPTGICSTFDQKADGIVLGNGAGMVLLKRLDLALEDNDNIHAIIRGFSVNNDANTRIGFTAPGTLGQQAVVQSALAHANLQPEEISYIEAHGTGTILGDLVEIEALNKVFSSCDKKSIAIGALKPNLGHLDAAAGIAGLIKVIYMLKHKIFLPNIHFNSASAQLKLDTTPFYVNTETQPWPPAKNPHAGVSSFGLGGTNAHVILSAINQTHTKVKEFKPVVLILSAHSKVSLRKMCLNLARYLEINDTLELGNIAYTLQIGRKSFLCRAAFEVTSLAQAITKLKNFSTDNVNYEPFLSWLNGKNVSWKEKYHNITYARVPLPTYCFDEKRYWITREQIQRPQYKSVSKHKLSTIPTLEKEKTLTTIKSIYEKFLLQENFDVNTGFEELGGDSLLSLLITHEISQALKVKVPFSIVDNNLSVIKLTEKIIAHIENQDMDTFKDD